MVGISLCTVPRHLGFSITTLPRQCFKALIPFVSPTHNRKINLPRWIPVACLKTPPLFNSSSVSIPVWSFRCFCFKPEDPGMYVAKVFRLETVPHWNPCGREKRGWSVGKRFRLRSSLTGFCLLCKLGGLEWWRVERVLDSDWTRVKNMYNYYICFCPSTVSPQLSPWMKLC